MGSTPPPRGDGGGYQPPAPPVDRRAQVLSDLADVVAGFPRCFLPRFKMRLQRLHARRVGGRHGLLAAWVRLFRLWLEASRGVRLRRVSVDASGWVFRAWRAEARRSSLDRLFRLIDAELG